MPTVNHVAVLVVVVLQTLLGFLWYSPAVFFKPWHAGLGQAAERMNASDMTPFIAAIAGSFLMTYGLAWLLHLAAIESVGGGVALGAVVWALFMAPPLVYHHKFMAMPLTVIAVDVGRDLVAAMLAGAMLSAWR